MAQFFTLLKNNALLFSIIMTGNFSQINTSDLKSLDYFFPTDSGLVINNFNLNNENFKMVDITFPKNLRNFITFTTDDSKYYENPEYYFGKNSEELSKNPYEINGRDIKRNRKDLGIFHEFGKDIDVTLYKSSSYGYSISLKIK